MALYKKIKNELGIPLEYHRINSIDHIINGNTKINVYSYVDEEEREKEKAQDENVYYENVYKSIDVVELDYNDELTVEQAYNYLKTLDKYKGSTDV